MSFSQLAQAATPAHALKQLQEIPALTAKQTSSASPLYTSFSQRSSALITGNIHSARSPAIASNPCSYSQATSSASPLHTPFSQRSSALITGNIHSARSEAMALYPCSYSQANQRFIQSTLFCTDHWQHPQRTLPSTSTKHLLYQLVRNQVLTKSIAYTKRNQTLVRWLQTTPLAHAPKHYQIGPRCPNESKRCPNESKRFCAGCRLHP